MHGAAGRGKLSPNEGMHSDAGRWKSTSNEGMHGDAGCGKSILMKGCIVMQDVVNPLSYRDV